MKYFESLLPALASAGSDMSLFYETKANLKHHQVALLSAAGVRAIQPGIESLSTHVLKLMDKGVTALQNVRLLKWCAEFNIRVVWNLLYGFPGETSEDYMKMADLVPSLVHWTPPTLGKLAVYRFSPHYNKPEKYGLVVDGPLPFYKELFKIDDDGLANLAHSFRYHHRGCSEPEQYLGKLPGEIRRWRDDADRSYRGLTYRKGPSFLRITDSRTSTTDGRGLIQYQLDEVPAQIYLACDAGASVQSLQKLLRETCGKQIGEIEIKNELAQFVEARLMMEEDGRYLSLAVPYVPRQGAAYTTD